MLEHKNKIISIEGGEGSGKSTVIHYIKTFLEERGADVMITREPGGVDISEKIRAVILDCTHTSMDAKTEALLFAAARRQHLVEKVLPAVAEGKWVVFDRFVDSSLVYQGFVRGIGVDEVYQINQFAIESFLPDLTLYLDVEPEVGLKRISNDPNREINRLDRETTAFHKSVREGYLQLLKKYPERMVKIDASGALTSVFDQIRREIEVLW